MTHVLDALGRIKEYWGELALGDLADYARGRIIRGGAADWEGYDASTLGAVLIGTGADVISTTGPTIVGAVTMASAFITGFVGAGPGTGYMSWGWNDPVGQVIIYVPDTTSYKNLQIDTIEVEIRSIDAVTNAVTYALALEHYVAGASGAAGLGTGIRFQLEDDGGAHEYLGAIQCIQTDATAGAEHGAIAILTAHIGVDGLAERWRWDHDGAITVAGPSMTVPDDWWVGLGGAAGRLVFDSTPAPDVVAFLDCNVGINTTVPDYLADATARYLSILGPAPNGAGALALVTPDAGAGAAVIGKIEFLNLDGGAGVVSRASIAAVRDGADDASMLDFYTEPTGGGVTKGMTLSSISNLGVGAYPDANHRIEAYKASANSTELGIILVTGTGNEECIINFGDSLVGGARYQGRIFFRHADNSFRFWTDQGVTTALIIDANSHVYPGTNKLHDLGLASARWREIFCSAALNTGTSRLVPVQKNCAVDGTQLVRSTGGLRVTGEESDFLLAFCPTCGTVAMEELKHRMAPAVKTAPKVVLTGMEVVKHSGNTKSVVVNFRYGDDVEDELGIQKAPHNSTTLSDDELAAFLGMADDKERCAFLLDLGQIEWNALEKMEVVGPELDDEQVQIDGLIRDLIGKDLLKGGTDGKPN